MPALFDSLSLFSGGMGLDLGVAQSGRFRLRAASEKVPAFCDTIRENRSRGTHLSADLVLHEGDIAGVDAHDLWPHDEAPRLVYGGPPCQSFSTIGKRGGTTDARGLLLWQFLRVVDALRPSAFVMENVRGVLSASVPGGERGSVIERWVADLPAGYRVDAYAVNAVNHGAPQARERVLFFGNRHGLAARFPEPTHGPGLLPYRTLGDALAGLDDPDPVVLDFSERKKQYLRLVPPGGNWRSLPPEVARESMGKSYELKGGRSAYWRRLSFGLPAPTILTMPNHAGTSLCHPTETRALSLRECARVQEFPDDWVFSGTPAQQYTQVGNAVPVRLGHLAGTVAADLLDRADAGEVGGGLPRYGFTYLDSHVRCRRWYAGGRAVVRSTDRQNADDAA